MVEDRPNARGRARHGGPVLLIFVEITALKMEVKQARRELIEVKHRSGRVVKIY